MYVRFSKSSKTKQISMKTMFATGDTVGLAEWIIDGTCLVIINYPRYSSKYDIGESLSQDRSKLNRK